MSCLTDYLKKLNRINPAKSKQNYRLFKSALAILIVFSLVFKVSQNLAQETDPELAQIGNNLQEFINYEDNHESALAVPSSEAWGENQMNNSFEILGSAMIGKFSIDDTNGEVSYKNTGLVSSMSNAASQLYITPPASGIQYISNTLNNILGKPAYAQTGFGFQGLEPILPIWKAFRNIVYMLSAIFFIVLGIMIMFRLKINPQTILTVQNAIPKIITTLLLVTFSYAIAGLLIDIATLIQNVILASLFTAFGKNLDQNLFTPKFLIGTPNNFKNLSDAGLYDYRRLIKLALPSNSINIIQLLIFGIMLIIPATAGASIPVFLILKLLVAIFITINIIKFLIGLVKAYINIILKIILAPLEIGISAFPGVKMGFNTWFKGLFANLMVFPISLLFLVLANLIISQVSFKFGLWAPNSLEIKNANLIKLISAGATLPSGGIIPVVLGIATIMILPKLPELIPQVIFAIKPDPFQSAIGVDLKTAKQYTVGTAASAVGNAVAGNRGGQGPVVQNPTLNAIVRAVVTSLGGKTD